MANKKDAGKDAMGASFKLLIEYCEGYGADYKPTSDLLLISALNTLYGQVDSTLKAVETANSLNDHLTNEREIAFLPLPKLSTKITNSYIATTAPVQSKNDIRSINNKIQGKRASGSTTVEETEEETEQMPEAATRSTSERGFANQLKNMKRMVTTLKVSPLYAPNESELQVTSLEALVIDLEAKMKAANAQSVVLSNARIARDKVFETDNVGMVDITKAVKAYVKSAFGATSRQYRQVSKLKFVKSKKKS